MQLFVLLGLFLIYITTCYVSKSLDLIKIIIKSILMLVWKVPVLSELQEIERFVWLSHILKIQCFLNKTSSSEGLILWEDTEHFDLQYSKLDVASAC
jgi:hypothetical protein